MRRTATSRSRTCPMPCSAGAARAHGSASPSAMQILDVAACASLLDGAAAAAAAACASPHLNALMERGPQAWAALRAGLSRLLRHDAARREEVARHLAPLADVELMLPVRIGNFTDFFASIFHATNAGRLFPPRQSADAELQIRAGRLSQPRLLGARERHAGAPAGWPDQAPRRGGAGLSREPQSRLRARARLLHRHALAARRAGAGRCGRRCTCSASASSTTGRRATSRPGSRSRSGPFLAKNFATTVSPFVVTTAALAPYRTRAYARPAGDPAPLPHLTAPADQEAGGLDIVMEALLLTAKMRAAGAPPFRLSRGSFADVYWTVAQMIAHHTSNGCNLEVGDLMGSGTVSGPERGELGEPSRAHPARQGADRAPRRRDARLPRRRRRGDLPRPLREEGLRPHRLRRMPRGDHAGGRIVRAAI